MEQEFRTNFSKIKSLGSAKEGLSHWLNLRWTSLLLLPFTLWFVVKIINLCMINNKITISSFNSIWDLICFIIFLLFSIYHGLLGMEVIIEDYVHQKLVKRSLIILLKFICLVSAISFILILFNLKEIS